MFQKPTHDYEYSLMYWIFLSVNLTKNARVMHEIYITYDNNYNQVTCKHPDQ